MAELPTLQALNLNHRFVIPTSQLCSTSRQWGFGFGNSQLTNRRTSLTHSRQYDPLDGCGINIAISNYYITVVAVNIISLTRKFTDNNKDEILKVKVISIFCQFL